MREITHALTLWLQQPDRQGQVYFAGNQQPAPELAYQVNFPRLELVLEGQQKMKWEDIPLLQYHHA